MIYLDNIRENQQFFVPKSLNTADLNYIMTLRSTIDLTEKVFNVQDEKVSEQYYRFSIALPAGMSAGSYEYSVRQGNKVMAAGILIIREDRAAYKENYYEQNYRQYEGR